MPLTENDFRKNTRETLAKRAGQTCSSPYCTTSTTGPHSEDAKSVDVGEAAHIRGARPKSKRYDSLMTPVERRAITNGIWLCRRCAKLIDSDEKRYTVELLYEWKREHEQQIDSQLNGQVSYRRIWDSTSNLFINESPAVQQIVLDKPDYWEFLLTLELFRERINCAKQKHCQIQKGLIFNSAEIINTHEELRLWFRKKVHELKILA